jgi:BirA family transcriptional regulator, biotin operon repressor / biotin---[acetyl-CoA-carboxylase] ligase
MKTLFIGKNIVFLPEIPSTNSYAMHLLKNVNLAEGTLVHTANQTQGKGQWDKRWSSEPSSNLTASVILKPSFIDLKKQFFLYQIAALACYDTITDLLDNGQFDIKIKWPNDILVNRKKVAGILIENNIQPGRINWSVVGIGMNVNQVSFPEHLNAGSLKLASGKDFEVNKVMNLLCENLEKYYLRLKNKNFSEIRSIYLERLFGLNKCLKFDVAGRVEELTVSGISEIGLLVLVDKNKNVREVDVKEVKWLFDGI